MAHNPLEHVLEQYRFPLFEELGIHLPLVQGWLTNYMVLELLAAVLIYVLMWGLAQRTRDGELPRGVLWNGVESILSYLRDEVARPSLGDEDADTYTPFLWVLFLFVLFCNLFGMVPFLGSPTASIAVTGALALIAFGVIHVSGFRRNGAAAYVQSFIPPVHFGNPLADYTIGLVLKVFIFVLEVFGALMRGVVLAVRLFANLFAGHTLLAVMLAFIPMFVHEFHMSDALFWPGEHRHHARGGGAESAGTAGGVHPGVRVHAADHPLPGSGVAPRALTEGTVL